MNNLTNIFDELFIHKVEEIRSSSSICYFNENIDESKGIVLVGGGELCKKIVSLFNKKSIKILGIADNNPLKWGREIDNIRIYSFKKISERYGDKVPFIICIWSPRHSYIATKVRLEQFGVKNILPFQLLIWKYPIELLPHYQFTTKYYYHNKYENLSKTFDMLEDDTSKEQLIGHLAWKMYLDYEKLPQNHPETQYFDPSLVLRSRDEIFIDGGAYDGDTIRTFLWYYCEDFRKIFAFEPDRINYERLNDFIGKLPKEINNKIIPNCTALGKTKQKSSFESTGAMRASITKKGKEIVNVNKIDEMVNVCSFIKLDIEGEELNALKGAKRTIEKSRPILTTCIYHKPDDFFEIPNYISKHTENYSHYIRTHDEDGLEIVLYSIPNERKVI